MIVRSSTNNPLGKRPLNFMADRYGMGNYVAMPIVLDTGKMRGLGDYVSTAPPVVVIEPAPGPNLAMLAIAGAAFYFFFVKGR